MNRRTVILVIGMHDNASRERVVTALEAVSGVQEVDVSLYRARAAVVHSIACDVSALVKAVAEAGFEGRALPGPDSSTSTQERRHA
jgi:copper chaperone CopZ